MALVAGTAICANIFESFDVTRDLALEITLELHGLDDAADRCLLFGCYFIGSLSWVNLGLSTNCATKRDPHAIKSRECVRETFIRNSNTNETHISKISLDAACGED